MCFLRNQLLEAQNRQLRISSPRVVTGSVKKHWKYGYQFFSFLIVSIALPIIWFYLSNNFWLSIYLMMTCFPNLEWKWKLLLFLSIYVPTYSSITLSVSPLLIFFQSLYFFPCLPLFSSKIYVSFSLSFPSFPNSLSSSLCLYLYLFLSLMLSLFCFSEDAMDWIARPMS